MRTETRRLRAGDVVDLDAAAIAKGGVLALLLQGESLLRVPTGASVLLVVLRGSVSGQGSEGRWRAPARRWLLLGREAAPVLQGSAGAQALVVVVDALSCAGLDPLRQALLPSRGVVTVAAARRLGHLRRALRAGDLDPGLLRAGATSALESLLAGDPEATDLLARAPGRTVARRRQLLCRMLRARFYIEGHPERIVRITELARLSSFSPWHFTKTFHQLFGQSPQAFGASVRLARARELVCETRMAIGEVAAAVGFENACSFARAFHERYGETATQMRARAQPPEAPRRRHLAH